MIIEVSEPARCAILCSLAVAGELGALTLISLQFTVFTITRLQPVGARYHV